MDMIQKISALGIVPVIKLTNPDNAVPLCRALARGGLPVAEITFRTAAAEESIRRVAHDLPEILVGAGTVLTTEQADKAIFDLSGRRVQKATKGFYIVGGKKVLVK